MGNNFIGVLVTLLLIFGCMGLALLCARRYPTLSRKIIHIGVSLWYFIYISLFTSPVPAVAGLLAFALFNFFVTSRGLFSGHAEGEESRRSWGMVWYPLSVAAMVLLSHFGIGTTAAFGCGLLGMGWGDGLAALVGSRFGKRRIVGSKTWVGTVTMLCVVTLICGLLTGLWGMALVCGIVGAVLEAVTPLDLDNISVPLGIYAVAALWSAYVCCAG